MKAKYTLTIVTSLIITFSSYSQETIVNIEDRYNLDPYEAVLTDNVFYVKDTNNLLNKFLGSWIYDDGIHYLKIVVTKHTHIYDEIKDYEDEIWIKTEYKLNGVEKYNTTGGIFGNYMINTSTVKVIYKEPSLTSCYRRKIGDLRLEYSINPSNVEQLGWTRTNTITEGKTVCPNGGEVDDSDFLIPANLLLTKQ